MSFELREKLAAVASQLRSLRLWTALALCWLVWAIIGGSAYFAGETASAQPLGWIDVAILALASAMICAIFALRTARDERAVARRIEAKHPELGTLLLAAVEHASAPRKQLGYLQSAVICEAVAHGRLNNWSRVVGPWRLRFAKLFQFITLGLLIAVCVGLATRAGANSGIGSSLFGKQPAAGPKYDVAIDPGNSELERGTPLIVIAQFKGALPPEATLVVDGGATGTQSLEMSRSLDDPKYVARLASVNEDLSYRVDFAGRSSDTYRITVFDYPALVRADARLEFPQYTGLKPKVIEDVRHVSAVEGTKLSLDLRLNKPVAEAALTSAASDEPKLAADPKDAKLYHTEWTLSKSGRYKLQLRDDKQRTNRTPEEIIVTVTPNHPPKVAIQRPARDVEVSPLEELQIKWNASDDYGIARSGLSYSMGGAEPKDIEPPLPARDNKAESDDLEKKQGKGKNVAKKQATNDMNLAHLIELESLNAKPDDLLSYFVWAEDIGPDGKPRRVSSDMYFAEVRPFEQIFRQGEQPTEGDQRQQQQREQQQGQSGGQQKAEELVKLQKDIINATWKLIRREIDDKPTAEFPKDSQLVSESQQSAIDRANQTVQTLQDAQSRGHLQSAVSHMSQAFTQLSTATQKSEPTALRPALAQEQAAYQDLLKLRAREFEVVRGNRQQEQQQQRGQSASNSNRMQRQLNQLELSADENRYETQSRARSAEQGQAQQEQRETLNKLGDLARRQEDLNERLRELQSALEGAQSPREREELERELKRLRDQQQEIVRDTDEMIAKNDQANNQQQSQSTREQMEQSRDRMQQASKSLDQGNLSQAVTESARAGKQLNDVRDNLRKESANQFAQDMTEMRRQARDLDTRQQQISDQLKAQDAAPGRTLRDTGERAEAQEGLKEQQQDLRNLLDRMKQTVDAAEEPEPLLARQLYDAAREATQKRLDQTLDVARRLAEAGVRREAGVAMQAADEGVNNLRRGVERAAESVLGDETEALRRAQSEVDQLADELKREMNERNGSPQQNDSIPPAGDSSTRSPNATPQNADQKSPNNRNQSGQPNSQPNDQNQNKSRQPGSQRGEQPANANEESKGGGQQPQQQNGDRNRQGSGRNGRQQSNSQQNDADQNSADENKPDQTGAQPNDASQNNSEKSGARAGQRNQEAGQGDQRNQGNRQQSSLRGGQNPQPSRDGNNNNDVQQILDRNFGGQNGGGPGNPGGPITGGNFRDWSQRLRDVEEMIDDADLRSEAARIRDRAAEARTDYKKHAREPDWDKLKVSVAEPLTELSRRLNNELRRRESTDALVPIDRDPVPPEFTEQVRRYYEHLGSGE